MNTSSIRTRFMLLVGAMSILLAVSVGFGIYSDEKQTITSTKVALRTLVNTMVSNTGGKISNARQTLERLSDRPLIKQVNSKTCDGILKDLLNLNSDYANVTYTNLEGVAVCSAVLQPDSKPVNVGKAPWFQKFLKEQRFIVSDPFFGPITHKWVSVLSAPIWNERHEMVGGVQLPLDLKAYDPNISAHSLPAGSRYGFQSKDGILIWRNVDPEGAIGAPSKSEAARRIVEVKDGEFESTGSDGVVRFFSVVPMPETGWIAFVGVPVSEVYAAAKQRAITATAIALGAIALLIALALSITRRITGPLAELERATRSVLNGNLGTKVTTDGPSEVTNVATAFNAMTDKIEASTRLLEIEITEHKQTEVELRESEFRWKFAIEGSGDGLWDWDIPLNKVFFSTRWKEMLGFAEEDIGSDLGEWSKRIHPDDLVRVMADVQAHFDSTMPFYINEHRVSCKDGSWKWILDRGLVVKRDADNKPVRMIGTHSDISERKQAEDALRRSEERYRLLVETASEGILVAQGAHLKFVNPMVMEITGYKADELTSRHFLDFIHQDDRELMRTNYVKRLKGEPIAQRYPIRILSKNAGEKWVEISGARVEWEGQPAILNFVNDITERKQAEESLRQSEGRFRQMFENNESVMLLIDPDSGALVDANATAARFYGYPVETLKAMRIDQINTLSPDETAARRLQATRHERNEFIFLHRLASGVVRTVEVLASPIEMGARTLLFSIIHDVTARERATADLKRSNAELEQFSYAISHDMRQPLRMISSYMQLLEKDLADHLDAEKRQFFGFAIDGAKRLDAMMLGLLEYSRVGRKGEPPAWVESRSILDDALLFLQPAIAESQADVCIQGEWPLIHVSPDEMLRLMQNLFGNALKFRIAGHTPEIIVTSEIIGKEWRMSVSDNGVGILPDQIGRLFQVFQRLQSRADYEGTGIGLALCRKIVEHHYGRIWAESEGEGKGSKFCVALPQ